MSDRSLAVVAEIEKAVSDAQEARVRRVLDGVHLLHRSILQYARLGDVCIAVAAIFKVSDHETGHVRDAGQLSAGWHERWLSRVIGRYLEGAIDKRVSHGGMCAQVWWDRQLG